MRSDRVIKYHACCLLCNSSCNCWSRMTTVWIIHFRRLVFLGKLSSRICCGLLELIYILRVSLCLSSWKSFKPLNFSKNFQVLTSLSQVGELNIRDFVRDAVSRISIFEIRWACRLHCVWTIALQSCCLVRSICLLRLIIEILSYCMLLHFIWSIHPHTICVMKI